MTSRKLDHSEVVERTMEEWSHIFNMVSKAYGIRVTSYKGNQDLVYVPDFVCRIDSFKPHCAVICHKRVFDKFSQTVQINSAIAYLKHPEKFPDEYAKVPRNFIIQNSEDVLARIVDDDDVETLKLYIELLGNKFDLEKLNSILEASKDKVNIRCFVLDLKGKMYSPEELERIQTIREEKELGMRELTVSDWKKIWAYKKMDDGNFCLTLYKGEDSDLIVPATIGKVRVTTIGDHVIVPEKKQYNIECLKRREIVRSILIPEGIKSIGECAFEECKNLTSITVPNSLETLGKGAFSGCSGLADQNGFVIVGNVLYNYLGQRSVVLIPDFISEIDNKAFYGCRNLKEVGLPDGINRIGDAAFFGCSELETISSPETLKTIGQEAFRGCRKLADDEGFVIVQHVLFGYYGNDENIVIPEDVKVISSHAFENNSSVQTVTLPEALEIIGDSAFSSCISLNHINLPVNLKSIGKSAFKDCRKLTDLELPAGLEQLGKYAFEGCNLSEITIPGSVKKIPYWAFFGCKNLNKVVFQEGVEIIGEDAFFGCDNLKTVMFSDSIVEIKNAAFGSCRNLTEVVLPNYLKNLGQRAFSKCDNLMSVQLPVSLETIEREAFSSCWKLKQLYISEHVTVIGKDAFGWGVAIIGKPGGTAEQYAKDYHRKFIASEFSEEQ